MPRMRLPEEHGADEAGKLSRIKAKDNHYPLALTGFKLCWKISRAKMLEELSSSSIFISA